jgi:hypothetical protein
LGILRTRVVAVVTPNTANWTPLLVSVESAMEN